MIQVQMCFTHEIGARKWWSITITKTQLYCISEVVIYILQRSLNDHSWTNVRYRLHVWRHALIVTYDVIVAATTFGYQYNNLSRKQNDDGNHDQLQAYDTQWYSRWRILVVHTLRACVLASVWRWTHTHVLPLRRGGMDNYLRSLWDLRKQSGRMAYIQASVLAA